MFPFFVDFLFNTPLPSWDFSHLSCLGELLTFLLGWEKNVCDVLQPVMTTSFAVSPTAIFFMFMLSLLTTLLSGVILFAAVTWGDLIGVRTNLHLIGVPCSWLDGVLSLSLSGLEQMSMKFFFDGVTFLCDLSDIFARLTVISLPLLLVLKESSFFCIKPVFFTWDFPCDAFLSEVFSFFCFLLLLWPFEGVLDKGVVFWKNQGNYQTVGSNSLSKLKIHCVDATNLLSSIISKPQSSSPCTLTSVYIFSTLFSIHFQRCWQGEFA